MRIIFVFGLLLACVPSAALAAQIDRVLLGVYDSRQEASPADTMLHRTAEMPLNHLGYIIRYHDLRQGLPDADALKGAVAVISMLG